MYRTKRVRKKSKEREREAGMETNRAEVRIERAEGCRGIGEREEVRYT